MPVYMFTSSSGFTTVTKGLFQTKEVIDRSYVYVIWSYYKEALLIFTNYLCEWDDIEDFLVEPEFIAPLNSALEHFYSRTIDLACIYNSNQYAIQFEEYNRLRTHINNIKNDIRIHAP